MGAICPNFSNPDVAREFEELKNATSEAAAYHIWSLNNGNAIDKAPNGADSILFSTLLGYFNGDRTKAILAKAKVYGNSFLNWFGDWLNDPSNASKVVDENGEPLVVYHVTRESNIGVFKNSYSEHGFNAGIFFTTDVDYAKRITGGKNVYALFLHIVNPIINVDNLTKEKTASLFAAYDNLVEQYHDTGKKYSGKEDDGIIGHDEWSISEGKSRGVEYVVKYPNQIKSATDNNGMFSRLDNDIQYSVLTEPQYIEMLEELSLSRDKTEDFIYNFIDKILKVNPRFKLDRKSDFYTYNTLRGTLPDSYKIDRLALRVFGYPVGLNYDSELAFTESLNKELNNWTDNLYNFLLNPDELDGVDINYLRSLYYTKINLQDDIKLLQRYLNHYLDLSYFNQYELPRIQKLIDKKVTKQKVGYIIQKLKRDLSYTQHSISILNYAKNAKLIAIKNRIVAINTINNIKDLIKRRLLAEYNSYKVSEEELQSMEQLRPLYNAIQNAKNSTIVDNRKTDDVLFNYDTLTEISFKEFSDIIHNKYPLYDLLIRLIHNSNPLLKIKVGGDVEYSISGTVVGKFSPKRNELVLSKDCDIYTTIHELAHAGTYYGIVGRGENQIAFENNIGTFMNYIRDYIKNKLLNPSSFNANRFMGVSLPADIYGFTNASEFIAELYGNPAFLELLLNIPAMHPKQFKSILHEIWDKIVDFFNTLIGNKKVDKTALDQAKKLGFIAMQLQQLHILDVYDLLDKYKNNVQMMVVGEKGAKNLDAAEEATTRIDNLAIANEMEKAGKDALTIKRATGWERGADGKWRYEIDDFRLSSKLRNIINDDSWYEEYPKELTLRDIIYSKDLQAVETLYPELLDYTIKLTKDPHNGQTAYISIKNKVITLCVGYDDYIIRNAFVHEIQHFVQKQEGFEIGGNANYFMFKRNKENRVKIERNAALIIEKNKPVEDKIINLLDEYENQISNLIDRLETYDNRYSRYGFENLRLYPKTEKQKELAEKIRELQKQLIPVPTFYFDDSVSDEDLENYRKLAGETEARTVSKRRSLSSEERRNSLFMDEMYKDVAKEDLIFLLEGLNDATLMSLTNELESLDVIQSDNIEQLRIQYADMMEQYVNNELQQLLFNKDSDYHADIEQARDNATQQWASRVSSEIMQNTQLTLAEAFGLQRQEDGSWISINGQDDLLVQFVNTLGDGHGGSYTMAQESDLAHNTIMIGMDLADATTFNHELAHYYVRKFWNSKVILDALKAVDKRGMTDLEREEALVDKLTELSIDNLYNNNEQSWFTKTWNSISMMLHNTFNITNKTAKKALVNNAAKAFIVNEQLQHHNNIHAIYKMYHGTVYLTKAQKVLNKRKLVARSAQHLEPLGTDKDEVAVSNIVNAVLSKQKAADIKGGYTLQQYATLFNFTRRIKERMRRLQKHRIEMLNPNLLLVSIDGLLYEKINIIKEFVLNVSSNITTTVDALTKNKNSNYTFLSFNDLYNYKTDVIGYYVSLLNDTYLFLLDGTVTLKYDQQEIYNLSLVVYDLLNQCRSIDNEFKRQLKIVITRKLTRILEDSMDTLDPEWVERAKISLRGWIENDNIFGDISSFRDYIVGLASHSKSMVIRELHDILEDIDDKIYDESNKIGAQLRDLLYKARKEWRLHGHIGDFQKLFMEIDLDTGLPTGNFCRDLNWGTWQRRKDEYTSYILYNYSSRSSKRGIEQRIQEYLNDPQFELLIDEYGFPYFPDGCELFEKEYLEKINEWHSKNTERLFTPEYYKMRLSILSVKTLKALRVVLNNINEILNICRDKDGNIDLSILTPNQLAMLKHYLYDKDLLSNFYYEDGSPKTGDDLLIAEDLYNWNRFLKDAGIKYTPNITLYKTLRANSGNSLLFDNMWSTRIINPLLYDLLPPGRYKTEEYEKLKYMYNKLMSLIKPKGYYEPRVQDIWDDVNKQIKPEWYLFFKSLADLSDEIEQESLNNTKGLTPYKPFVPYNEMFTEKEVRHPTANMSWYTYIYKELEAKYMATNDPQWNNKFRAELNIIRKATAPFDALPIFFTTTFTNSTNTGTPQSYDYYLYIDDLDVNGNPTIITVNPIDNITKERTGQELYFATVRLVSGLFNELRPLLSDPTYINLDYDESMGAGRLSYPRPDVYDNSKSFNKIKGESKVLYDMLVDTMKTKYEELGIFKNDYDYRLPQRGGNAYQLAHRRKNFLSTMWWGIKREFLYVETDDFFNDNWAQRPDGSIVQNPKIQFVKRLDDPWAINSDVTGSVIKFAEMATEYRIKSENQGLIENILDVSKQTGPDTTQTAKLEHMVNTEFYGRKLTFNLRGQLKGSGKGKGSRAALKGLRRMRIIAQTHMLAFNLFSGIVSSLDPFFKLLVDALTGKYANAWDFIKAIGTIISQMPQAIRSLGRSRTTSKVQALLQKLGINRNIENTYHDLDRNLAYRFLTSGLGMMVFGLGDYTTTALTAVAMMKNFRFYKHSDPNKSGFYQHEEFVRVAMSDGKEKKDAEKLYRNAINYYAMYSYSDPKEGLKVKLNWSRGRRNSMQLKFSDAAPYLTEKLDSRIRKAIRSRVSVYNAIVLDNEKTQLQTNIWWSFISMLRNFLLVGINERFKDQRDFLVNPNSLNGLVIDPKTGNPINYTTKQIKRGLRIYTGGWNFQTRQIEPGVFTGAGRTIYQFFRKVKWFSSFIVRSTPSAIADMFMWWKKGRTSNWSKFKDTRKTLKENSLDISKADMWAFKKASLELALIAVLFLLYSFIIHPWADEHKDEYLALAIDYVTGRLLTETSTWVNPLTASDVVSSITPWTGDVKKKLMIVELCAQIYQIANNGLDEQMVKRGAYTGLPRWLRAAGNVYGPLGNFITSFRTDAIKSKSNYYEKIGFYYPLYKWVFSPTESVSAKKSSKKGKQKLSGKINPNKSGKVNRNIK